MFIISSIVFILITVNILSIYLNFKNSNKLFDLLDSNIMAAHGLTSKLSNSHYGESITTGLEQIEVVENNITEFNGLFKDLPEFLKYDIKKEQLLANFSALLSHANISQEEFIKLSKWQRWKLITFLNGSTTPSFKKIWEFATTIGYEVDIVFRLPNQIAPKQPWNK